MNQRTTHWLVACLSAIALVCGCESQKTKPVAPGLEVSATPAILLTPAALLATRTNYPAQWWALVSTNGAPSWEIFPQDARPGEVILSKRNELGLLSNFAPTPFTFRGKHYASIEGFWQAMKYPESDADPRSKFPGLRWKHTRAEVEQLSGFDAKHAGSDAEQNMKTMGINWVTFEEKQLEYRANTRGEFYDLVLGAMREKVRQNPEVKRVLLATGDLTLKPDHRQDVDAPPAWRYYEILEKLRAEIRQGR